MNTIKQTLAIGLLLTLTSNSAQGMSWAKNMWERAQTKRQELTLTGRILAQNAWDNMPTVAQATSMAKDALENASTKTQEAVLTGRILAQNAWDNMPSKQEIVSQAVKVAGQAKDVVVKHPYIATAAAVSIPAVVIAEYALKEKTLPTIEEYNKQVIFGKMNEVLNNLHTFSNDIAAVVLTDAQYAESKVAGSLGFEESIEELQNIIPVELSGDLSEKWNDFIAMATAYDRSATRDSLRLFTAAYTTLNNELEKLIRIVNAQDVALFNPLMSMDKLNTIASVFSGRTLKTGASVAVPTAVVAGLYKTNPGLINQSVNYVKNIDYKKAALKTKDAILDQYTRYKPAVGHAFDKVLTVAQNNKKVGALTACAVLGTGLAYKLHNYLMNDEVSFQEKSN